MDKSTDQRGKSMRSQSYLRLESEADCDIREDTRPLVVNCVGQYITDGAFTTNKPTGRQDIYLMYLSRGSLTLYVGDQRHELPAGGRTGALAGAGFFGLFVPSLCPAHSPGGACSTGAFESQPVFRSVPDLYGSFAPRISHWTADPKCRRPAAAYGFEYCPSGIGSGV